MPPITGYYAFIAGSVVFALLGTNPQLSVGADSTIAPLFAAGIGALAAVGHIRYIELVAILAVCVGVLVPACGCCGSVGSRSCCRRRSSPAFWPGSRIVIVDPSAARPARPRRPAAARTCTGSTTLGHRSTEPAAATAAIGLGMFALVLDLPSGLTARMPGRAGGAGRRHAARRDLRPQRPRRRGPRARRPWRAAHRPSGSVAARARPGGAGGRRSSRSSSSRSRQRPPGPSSPRAAASRWTSGATCSAIGAGNVLAGLIGRSRSTPARRAPRPWSAAGGRTQLPRAGRGMVMVALIPAAGVLTDVPLAALAGVLMFVAHAHLRVGELMAIARFSRLEFGLALVTMFTVASDRRRAGDRASRSRSRSSTAPVSAPGRSCTCSAGSPARRAGRRCRAAPIPSAPFPACWWFCSPRRSGTPTQPTSATSAIARC